MARRGATARALLLTAGISLMRVWAASLARFASAHDTCLTATGDTGYMCLYVNSNTISQRRHMTSRYAAGPPRMTRPPVHARPGQRVTHGRPAGRQPNSGSAFGPHCSGLPSVRSVTQLRARRAVEADSRRQIQAISGDAEKPSDGNSPALFGSLVDSVARPRPTT